MARRALTITAAVAALTLTAPAAATAADCPGADAEPAAQGLAATGRATVCLINAERAGDGLAPVTVNTRLTRASADYSDLLVARAFFAHETPEGVGLVERLTSAGYLAGDDVQWTVGENLAWAQGPLATPRKVVAAWMASPRHRRNILDAGFAEIGIGVAAGTPGAGPHGATFTTDFGARHPTALSARAPKPAAKKVVARRHRSIAAIRAAMRRAAEKRRATARARARAAALARR